MRHRTNPTMEKEFFAARPIKPDLGVLGRKWALLILADIGLRRFDRFSSLQRSNPRLNARILSRRLGELEQAGMIRRLDKTRAPGPVRWTLTEKGVDILPAVIRLMAFGARWHVENPFNGKLPRRLMDVAGSGTLTKEGWVSTQKVLDKADRLNRGKRFESLHPGFNNKEERHEASRYLFSTKKKAMRKNR